MSVFGQKGERANFIEYSSFRYLISSRVTEYPQPNFDPAKCDVIFMEGGSDMARN
jgi:hypothetical protein